MNILKEKISNDQERHERQERYKDDPPVPRQYSFRGLLYLCNVIQIIATAILIALSNIWSTLSGAILKISNRVHAGYLNSNTR
jgi:hypothetical protein